MQVITTPAIYHNRTETSLLKPLLDEVQEIQARENLILGEVVRYMDSHTIHGLQEILGEEAYTKLQYASAYLPEPTLSDCYRFAVGGITRALSVPTYEFGMDAPTHAGVVVGIFNQAVVRFGGREVFVADSFMGAPYHSFSDVLVGLDCGLVVGSVKTLTPDNPGTTNLLELPLRLAFCEALPKDSVVVLSHVDEV